MLKKPTLKNVGLKQERRISYGTLQGNTFLLFW